MKKKILLLLVFVGAFLLFNEPVIAAVGVVKCGTIDNIPKVIPRLSRFLFQLIKYIVPAIIILFGSIEFFKSSIGSDKEMLPKAVKQFSTKLIAGAVVFVILFLFQTVISIVSNDTNVTECISCFLVKEESCTNSSINQPSEPGVSGNPR